MSQIKVSHHMKQPESPALVRPEALLAATQDKGSNMSTKCKSLLPHQKMKCDNKPSQSFLM